VDGYAKLVVPPKDMEMAMVCWFKTANAIADGSILGDKAVLENLMELCGTADTQLFEYIMWEELGPSIVKRARWMFAGSSVMCAIHSIAENTFQVSMVDVLKTPTSPPPYWICLLRVANRVGS
jgi:hypothetical protein